MIRLEITADFAEEFFAKLRPFAAVMFDETGPTESVTASAPVAETSVAEAPKRTRRTKAEMEAERAAEAAKANAAPATVPAEEDVGLPEQDEKAITAAELKTVVGNDATVVPPKEAAPEPDVMGDEPAAETITFEDIRGVFLELKANPKLGGKAMLNLVSKFGATKVPDLKKEDYGKVLAEAKKMLAEAA